MDVKSSNVHFYVQRRSSYGRGKSVIPFEIERLNFGNAMNLATGVFTAPRNGLYHFAFSALKDLSKTSLNVHLRLNGNWVGMARADDLVDYSLTCSFQATLKLIAGDRIDLFLDQGTLLDVNKWHHTHFTGYLVEEDLQL